MFLTNLIKIKKIEFHEILGTYSSSFYLIHMWIVN